MADIFDYFKKIQDSMIKTINKSFSEINKSISSKYKRPSCEISQDRGYFTIKVELAGMSKRDVMLNITHDYLEVFAEKKGRRGRSYVGYRRIISLPPGLITDKVNAKFSREKLTIKIPKIKTGKVKVK